VIQVQHIGRNKIKAVFLVIVWQFFNFFPEFFGVDAVPFENRCLHVAGAQGFVKIPDAGNDILEKKRLSHAEFPYASMGDIIT
jgi:hypothetical protein